MTAGDPAASQTLDQERLLRLLGSGDVDTLNGVIATLQALAAQPAASATERAQALANLSAMLLTRYQWTTRSSDLEAAIIAGEQSLTLWPAKDATSAAMASNLGSALQTRYRLSADLNDLNRAIAFAREAADATAEGDPDRAGYLSNLAVALLRRSEHGEVAEPDLSTSIELLRDALAGNPSNQADRAALVGNLAEALLTRYREFGRGRDLDEAVGVGEQAVQATAGDSARADALSTLASALLARAEAHSDLGDLERAVSVGEEAVLLLPPGHADRPAAVSTLGYAYRVRFELAGAPTDLARAVALSEAAVQDASVASATLTNLALALRLRFEWTADRRDLTRAVDVGRDAVRSRRPRDVAALSNLAGTLQTRFELTGSGDDLAEAIELLEQALDLVDDAHHDRPTLLANTGAAVQARFSLSERRADIDRAVDLLERAVQTTTPTERRRAGRLSNLSIALRARGEHGHDANDLERALTLAVQATAAVGRDHPDRCRFLSNASVARRAMFALGSRPQHLSEAIALAEEAVDAVPDWHPDQARYHYNLGLLLGERAELSGSVTDRDQAVSSLAAAAAVTAAPPLTRALAARQWGVIAASAQAWASAIEGFASAIALQRLVAARSLSARDREQLLSQLASIGPQAAACCLQLGDTARAVSLIEQARSVLLGQVLDTHADLTALEAAHPKVAARFVELCAELNRGSGPNGSDPTAPASAGLSAGLREWRRQAGEEFEELLAWIRALPGFATFLAPPAVSELLAAAGEGPIVLVNVSDIRSDALILTPEGVDVVELPAVEVDSLRERMREIFVIWASAEAAAAPAFAGGGDEGRLRALLGWLWDALAEPVLDRLGITGSPPAGEPWPRVWWSASGLLSFLPLHAAGHHETRFEATPLTVLDRVVSAYTPTIRALVHGRRPRPAAGARQRSLLVCALPDTPWARPLPGAAAEARYLQELWGADAETLTGSEATFSAVMAAVARHRWAHFACHGVSDLDNPSASRLVLHDHLTRPLTVMDLAGLGLADAELAFLSACSTAQPSSRLPDEALHLAAACQVAGYRGVIATLWPVNDSDATTFGASVYPAALNEGNSLATSVHRAVRRRRDLLIDAPTRWAVHTYHGA